MLTSELLVRCARCGARSRARSRFCGACGQALDRRRRRRWALGAALTLLALGLAAGAWQFMVRAGAGPRRVDILASVVQVKHPFGSGSGTIVSPRGLILTAFHVVADYTSGRPYASTYIVGLVPDELQPAVDRFAAEVALLDQQRDLALLRITGSLDAQPLPARFPYLRLGAERPPPLGAAIDIFSFPDIGDGSLIQSEGLVSGFGEVLGQFYLKTDSFISPGSSGGAALDRWRRLIGVPVAARGEEPGEQAGAGRLGLIVPVANLLPAFRAAIAGGPLPQLRDLPPPLVAGDWATAGPLLALGRLVKGELSSADPVNEFGGYYDQYAFWGGGGQQVVFRLFTDGVNGLLGVLDPMGNPVAEATGRAAEARAVLRGWGTYQVLVSSVDPGLEAMYTLEVEGE